MRKWKQLNENNNKAHLDDYLNNFKREVFLSGRQQSVTLKDPLNFLNAIVKENITERN